MSSSTSRLAKDTQSRGNQWARRVGFMESLEHKGRSEGMYSVGGPPVIPYDLHEVYRFSKN
jgi:hypothetical protein